MKNSKPKTRLNARSSVQTKTKKNIAFSSATISFLKKASKQKNPLWLEKNRDEYDEVIREPLSRLAEVLSKELKKEAPLYHFPKKGIGRLKRASNRVRIHGGGIFKNYLSYTASSPNPSRFEKNPSIFFMVNSEDTEGDEVLLAGGLYMPSSRQLKGIRQAVSEDPKPFEDLFKERKFKKSFKNGFSDERKSTRVPRGFEKTHPYAEWLKLQGFYVWRSYPKKVYTSSKFAELVAEDAKLILKLNQLLDEAVSGTWNRSLKGFESKLSNENRVHKNKKSDLSESSHNAKLTDSLGHLKVKLYKPDF